MHRPVAFRERADVHDFMARKLPLHTYYSTAYYSNPEAPMREKEWLGADLIFDLDADHLPSGDEMTYPQQLELVKKKTKLLLEDFLEGDFGFREENIQIVFSGNRGYHIHVRKKEVLSLSRGARREIVDHITGTGLDLPSIFPYTEIEVDRFRDYSKSVYSYRFPSSEKGGWSRRASNMIKRALRRWSQMSKDEVIQEIRTTPGIDKAAEGLYHELYELDKWEEIIKQESLDVLEEKGKVNQKHFLKIFEDVIRSHTVNELSLEFVGTTDEPVTGDTKRLIRLPTSIHGGSFMVVEPIGRDEFYDFDPLRDAVIPSLGDELYAIRIDRLPKEDSIYLRDKEFEIEEEMKLPEFALPFFITKYRAKVL